MLYAHDGSYCSYGAIPPNLERFTRFAWDLDEDMEAERDHVFV